MSAQIEDSDPKECKCLMGVCCLPFLEVFLTFGRWSIAIMSQDAEYDRQVCVGVAHDQRADWQGRNLYACLVRAQGIALLLQMCIFLQSRLLFLKKIGVKRRPMTYWAKICWLITFSCRQCSLRIEVVTDSHRVYRCKQCRVSLWQKKTASCRKFRRWSTEKIVWTYELECV